MSSPEVLALRLSLFSMSTPLCSFENNNVPQTLHCCSQSLTFATKTHTESLLLVLGLNNLSKFLNGGAPMAFPSNLTCASLTLLPVLIPVAMSAYFSCANTVDMVNCSLLSLCKLHFNFARMHFQPFLPLDWTTTRISIFFPWVLFFRALTISPHIPQDLSPCPITHSDTLTLLYWRETFATPSVCSFPNKVYTYTFLYWRGSLSAWVCGLCVT